jgi:formylglycine-generating enzyme required for sulfatase activity
MVVKRFLVLTTLMITLAVTPALAAKRVALVIGNSTYQHTAKLSNPQNDANLMARTLRRLGFDVLARTNLTQTAMKIAITEFGEQLEKAGKDAVGLFYYAGHGIQSNGNNYLIPVDAKLGKKSHLEIYGVNANWVLAQMEEAKNPLNLMVLDACRNNPFGRSWQRGINKGLARMDAPRGTMIAYATRPGKVAADGTGANSPYTKALAKAMVKPGLTLSDVFIETRNTVMASTGGNQVPWEEGGLTSRFYFKQGSTVPTATTTPNLDKETVFWNSIKDSDDPDMFNEYLRQYPRGSFAGLAQLKVKKLKAAQVAVLNLPKPAVPLASTPAVGVYPQNFRPGSVFKDCPDCPEMVVIPAGSFMMGSSNRDDETPIHRVTIPANLAVGKVEVTFKQWDACVAGGGCNGYRAANNGYDRSVSKVSWNDAQSYIDWVNRKTGASYRLLSESEWEYAARAGKSDNSFGIHEMHDDDMEWVEDCYWVSYDNSPSDGNAYTGSQSCSRVLRGGSWHFNSWLRSSTHRRRGRIDERRASFGFRVARDLE